MFGINKAPTFFTNLPLNAIRVGDSVMVRGKVRKVKDIVSFPESAERLFLIFPGLVTYTGHPFDLIPKATY